MINNARIRCLYIVMVVMVSCLALEVGDNLEFSGGKPAVDGDGCNPNVVNDRSAEFYNQYGTNHRRGILLNAQARQWYLDQKYEISNRIGHFVPLRD
ncbi:MAG: hypothetical protein OIF38_04895 [Cellvibrionaceae bacterium]|nr:hypothetical protein [Cellvibrionaceae bacterium]